MSLRQNLSRREIWKSLFKRSHVNAKRNAKQERRMWRARHTIAVAAAIGQSPKHRAKIKTANPKLTGQFVAQNLGPSSQRQEKRINCVRFNKLSQIFFYQVQIGIQITAVVAHLVVEDFCLFWPVVGGRLLKLRCLLQQFQ